MNLPKIAKGCLIFLGVIFIYIILLLLFPDFIIQLTSKLLIAFGVIIALSIVMFILNIFRYLIRKKHTKEYYTITADMLPNNAPPEFGNFIEGYTSDKSKRISRQKHLLCIYEKGFIWQEISSKGIVGDNKVILFNEIEGISSKNTDNRIAGVNVNTTCNYSIIDRSGNLLLEGTGQYKHKDIKDAEYDNYFGYAFNSLLNHWNTFVSERYKNELDENGYMTFVTGNDIIHIGTDYMEIFRNQEEDYFRFGNGNLRVTQTFWKGSFKHNINDGTLTIITKNEKGKREICPIDVNSMYNKIPFIIAFASQMIEIHNQK